MTIINNKKGNAMPLFCDVDDSSGKLNVEISFTSAVFQRQNAEILKSIITSISLVKHKYKISIDKFKKILGQDRISLLELLDTIFTDLALLHLNFLSEMNIKSDDERLTNLKIPIRLNDNSKSIVTEGILELNKNNINNFETSFDELVVNSIKEFLNEYKNVNETKNDLNLILMIDSILYSILLLRYLLKNCLLDK